MRVSATVGNPARPARFPAQTAAPGAVARRRQARGRYRERVRSRFIVNRILAFAAAFAFAAAQPAVTLAAHPGGGAAALDRQRRLLTRSLPAVSAIRRPPRFPLHDIVEPLRVTPPQKMEPQHFTGYSPGRLCSAAAGVSVPRISLASDDRLPLLSGSAWNGPACLSRSSALNPPSEFASPDSTIGSLVDGKSNLFSPQSHDPGYAAASSLAATNSPLPAFQGRILFRRRAARRGSRTSSDDAALAEAFAQSL